MELRIREQESSSATTISQSLYGRKVFSMGCPRYTFLYKPKSG
jgi:hypothetical protein